MEERKMLDINILKFDEKGLIPAVVIDNKTKKLLTLLTQIKTLHLTM